MDSEMMSSTLNSVPSLQFLSSSPPPLTSNYQGDSEDFQDFANYTSSSEFPSEINGDEMIYTSHTKHDLEPSGIPGEINSIDAYHKKDDATDMKKITPEQNKLKDSSSNSSPEHSHLATPPPLDCVHSSSIDDLDIASPSHHRYIVEDDDEFGDFISTIEKHGCDGNNQITIESDVCKQNDTIVKETCEYSPNIQDKKCPLSYSQSLPSDSNNSIPHQSESNQLDDKDKKNLNLQNTLENNDSTYSSGVILAPDSQDVLDIKTPQESKISRLQPSTVDLEDLPNLNSEYCESAIDHLRTGISESPISNEDLDVPTVCHDFEADFSDFASYQDPNPKEEDFGEFSGCENQLTVQDKNSEFGDFDSFQTAPFQITNNTGIPKENVEANCDIDKIRNLDWLDEDEDEYSSFETALPSNQTAQPQSDVPLYSHMSNKFETLFSRWVPKMESEPIEDISTKINEVVDGDAFVWHHLEDIDSSVALKLTWANSNAQKFFLGSLGVDARNILFGQRFSSSIPAFAQTLSFSPLTPARSSQSSSVSSWDNIPQVLTPKLMLDEKVIAQSSPKDTTERVIPPAQFDWSSSGLTNPLEVPGLEQEILQSPSLPNVASESGQRESSPAASSLMEKILNDHSRRSSPSHETPFHSLHEDVKEIVKGLPSLSFMKAKVLMFPIRGESKNT